MCACAIFVKQCTTSNHSLESRRSAIHFRNSLLPHYYSVQDSLDSSVQHIMERLEMAAPEIRVHFSGRLQYAAQHICITNYPSNTPGEIVNIWLTIQKMFHFNSVQQGSHSRHTLHTESYNTLTLTQDNIQKAGIEQRNGGDQSTVLKN